MISENPKVKERIHSKVLRLVLLSIAVIVIVVFVYLFFTKEPPPELETYTVTRQDLEITLTEPGEIKALRNDPISMPGPQRPERGGGGDRGGGGRGGGGMTINITMSYGGSIGSGEAQIIQLIPEGTRAEVGDTLIRFDTSELLTQREMYVENLIAAQEAYDDLVENHLLQEEQEERSIENQTFTLESRRLNLALAEFSSENTIKEMEIQLKIAELDSMKLETRLAWSKISRANQLARAQRSINDINNRIEQVDAQIAAYTVIAEYPALVVYEENPQTEQKVKVGDRTFTYQQLLQLPDLSSINAVIHINDIDREKVWLGQEGRLHLEAYPDSVFYGEVTDFALISQSSQRYEYSNVKIFELHLLLDGTDPRLVPGMTAMVEFVVERIEDVPVIPLSAVFESNDITFVYKVGESIPKQVVLGKKNELMVEVKSGLEEGDVILKQRPRNEGFALGYYDEKQRREEAIAMLDEHFRTIEELGISYNYDRYREQSRLSPMRGSGYQSMDVREPTYDEVITFLEMMDMENTAQNREEARELIMSTQNAGRDSGLTDLQRALGQGMEPGMQRESRGQGERGGRGGVPPDTTGGRIR
ncbi:hypothetical protein AMJ80_00730 [bacterium SM23_31]|nr:MAG: hypothetical protein AMJ80_00730 [bacterium SM23_31]